MSIHERLTQLESLFDLHVKQSPDIVFDFITGIALDPRKADSIPYEHEEREWNGTVWKKGYAYFQEGTAPDCDFIREERFKEPVYIKHQIIKVKK